MARPIILRENIVCTLNMRPKTIKAQEMGEENMSQSVVVDLTSRAETVLRQCKT